MLKHERLRQLALRIEQGRSPLRWLDLYAAQSLLESAEDVGDGVVTNQIAHSKVISNNTSSIDTKKSGSVDARTVDLLVLSSACSLVGQVSVILEDLAAYQSLGLYFGLSSEQSANAEMSSDIDRCIERLTSLGLLQSKSFSNATKTDDDLSAQVKEGGGDTDVFSPLVLTEGQLYLRRVWLQRSSLECWLSHRQQSSEAMLTSTDLVSNGVVVSAQESDALITLLHNSFRELFGHDSSETKASKGNSSGETLEPDWQAVAAVQALSQSFCLVSGGPGTGKTSTAARILLLLLIRHVSKNRAVAAVRLLAPTGKAAVRLHTAISQQFQRLCRLISIDEMGQELIAKSFPEQGETIHRALLRVPGAVGDDNLSDRINFHRSDSLLLGAAAPSSLRADIILIDEASMIDQKLMTDLVRAIPESSTVVMLGDHFQLPPVEPGEVFADWIARLEQTDYSPAQIETMAGYSCAIRSAKSASLAVANSAAKDTASPAARLICQLQRTYRFSGPIFEMAQALRGYQDWSLETLLPLATPLGRASGPEDLFARAPLTWVNIDTQTSSGVASKNTNIFLADQFEASLAGYASYFELVKKGASAAQLAIEKDRFQILCSTYEGPLGAAAINRLIEQRFAHSQSLYEGKVVMVTQNQPDLDLYNGDVGYLQGVSDSAQQQFVVAFPDKADGEVRVPLLLIRQWQSAYAISIHKSQGCEYERVMVVVPDYARDLVTRRLVYTGITRSQKEVELWMSRASLAHLGAK
jgi:exodeoxyribonuclease V alpha subunit